MIATASKADKIAVRIANRYIPPNSAKVEHRLATFYTVDGLTGPKQKPFYSVICYIGTAGKCTFYYRYNKAELRDKQIADTIAGLESSEAMKADWKASREKPHTVKVGDIIHHAWGWEQTQADFYAVLAVTAHGATIQAIQSQSLEHGAQAMSCREIPIRDAFTGEPFKVRISGDNHVGLKHGSAGVWDGQPKYHSWYA